jgi:hypothetical protein
MKNLKLILAVVGVLLLLSSTVKAQVSVSINVGQPMWGPVGYTEVRYYYLPAVEAYYDVHSSMFIYYSSGTWVHRTYLPSRNRNYDLYNGYKVVLTDYRGTAPYLNFRDHKKKYNRGYNNGHQKTIGNNPGKGNSKSEKHNGGGHGKKGKH